MTDQTTHSELPADEPRHASSRFNAFWVVFLMVLVLFIMVAIGWVQLNKSAGLSGINAKTIANLQETVANLQASIKKSEELSETTKQLMQSWQADQQGSLTQWHIAEANYLVKLASDQLQLTQNDEQAKLSLTEAEAILKKIDDSRVMPLRQSIASDLSNLESNPAADITSIYMRLNALNAELDRLPLPEKPLAIQETPPSTLPDNATNWEKGWGHIKQSLQKVVVVRRLTDGEMPLVMPEEKTFLLQNLHAQIEQAMWAVLHRNDQVFQASIARASAWINTYFVVNMKETQAVLDQLKTLQSLSLKSSRQPLTATLDLFERYSTNS